MVVWTAYLEQYSLVQILALLFTNSVPWINCLTTEAYCFTSIRRDCGIRGYKSGRVIAYTELVIIYI
jgi:hypothetical protein